MAYIVRDISKFASIFTLALLSVDRCLASYHHLGALRTVGVGKTAVGVIWVACGLVAVPYLTYAGIRGPSKTRRAVSCQLIWPSDLAPFWMTFQFLLGLIIPLTIIFVAYSVLFRRIRQIRRRRAQARNAAMLPSRRMLHTVLVIVITFVVCQTPYYVLQWVAVAKQRDVATHHQQGSRVRPPNISQLYVLVVANMFSQILVFVSSCCNPIIYGLLNNNFRTLRSFFPVLMQHFWAKYDHSTDALFWLRTL